MCLPTPFSAARARRSRPCSREHSSLFFQAEDGIRYLYVTGVQTCALPICGVGAKFNEYPLDDWNLVMDVNCNGVFYSCLYESKEMLKAGKGSIVNIASTAGLIAYPTQGIRSSFSKLTASGVHCQQTCSHRNHQVGGYRTRRVGHSHQCHSPWIYRDNIVEGAC